MWIEFGELFYIDAWNSIIKTAYELYLDGVEYDDQDERQQLYPLSNYWLTNEEVQVKQKQRSAREACNHLIQDHQRRVGPNLGNNQENNINDDSADTTQVDTLIETIEASWVNNPFEALDNAQIEEVDEIESVDTTYTPDKNTINNTVLLDFDDILSVPEGDSDLNILIPGGASNDNPVETNTIANNLVNEICNNNDQSTINRLYSTTKRGEEQRS